MRSTALTALFFALFALFSSGLHFQKYASTTVLTIFFLAAVAYAAPVVPEGVISKRQCTMSSCRNAVSVDLRLQVGD
jgi:hypothetical protein